MGAAVNDEDGRWVSHQQMSSIISELTVRYDSACVIMEKYKEKMTVTENALQLRIRQMMDDKHDLATTLAEAREQIARLQEQVTLLNGLLEAARQASAPAGEVAPAPSKRSRL